VGAWNFTEASGTAALDSSGAGNPGTISGATRTTGRYGGGLSFDGVNDWVTVADANSLDLNRMTLEAWVRPNALANWRTVLLKEQAGQLAYALYASADNGRPSGHVFTTGDIALQGPSVLGLTTWTHLAMTWDGSTTRLYVNGSQVASAALAGNAVASNLPLRIGGNSVWGEWFNGVIDEVRVYNRPLSAAEIAGDRDTAVGTSAAALLAAQLSAPAATTRKSTRGMRRWAHLRRTGYVRRVHRSRWLNRPAGARTGAKRGSKRHRRAHRR
jgi:hypothetical protein